MQSMDLDALIKNTIYNSPIPLDLDALMEHFEGRQQQEIVSRAMCLAGDGIIDTLVEDGITFFVP